VVIWYIVYVLVCSDQEKSGNPAAVVEITKEVQQEERQKDTKREKTCFLQGPTYEIIFEIFSPKILENMAILILHM
jgi:predicted PhzF superfamily epimerase YddE/YHI9